ncbi:MAG: M20/M25/M40 family metallo-hydrolase [Acetobacterales bacterium]
MREGARHLDPEKVEAFYEIHIEQGPVLVHEEIPVGIVSGIRGNMRARHAKCLGEYAHSGATPRKLRHDAALGMAEFMTAMEAEWEKIEAAGNDLVFTLGKLYTDPDVHTHSKVPGEVRFTIDARDHEAETLDRVQTLAAERAARIGGKRGLTIDLGPLSRVKPATMAPALRENLRRGAETLGVSAMDIPSGGGHDAGDFANAGVPAATLFVRNPHGSHNPREDMAMEDFAEAVKLLAWGLTH